SDRDLEATVYAQTRGNPLYIHHMLRAEGAPSDGAEEVGDYDLASIVGARLGDLGADATEIANALAICPGPAPFQLIRDIAALADRPAIDAVDSLVAAAVLRETESGLAFSHDLVRAAVDAAMSSTRRGFLHRRAFRLLAEAAESTTVSGRQLAGTLAHHAA